MSLIGTLKDVSLGFGVVGFTYWQWTRARTYRFKQRTLCGLKIPFFIIWMVMYACVAVSWALLLFRANASHRFLLPSLVLLLVNIVLNKLWTVFAGDAAAAYPESARAWTIAAFVTLIAMVGTIVAYVVLTGIDAHWFPFAFALPYALWLGVALLLSVRDESGMYLPSLIESRIVSMPLAEPLLYERKAPLIKHAGLKK